MGGSSAQADWAPAQDRLLNAQRLAADVARRVRAGDLSRADQAQADGAVAQAEAALAEAQGSRDAALAALAAWGVQAARWPGAGRRRRARARPVPDATTAAAQHPAATDWQDQAEVARRAADLAAVQTRANPELTVAATRGASRRATATSRPSPWACACPGRGDRAQAKQATARAEALAAEARAAAERDRLAADIAAAVARVKPPGQRDALASPRSAGAGHTRLYRQGLPPGRSRWPHACVWS